jgi:hypothetical protein
VTLPARWRARCARKKMAAPEGAAKFREETSKKADSANQDRIAAMHKVKGPVSVRKRNFAVQHRLLWTNRLLASSSRTPCRV